LAHISDLHATLLSLASFDTFTSSSASTHTDRRRLAKTATAEGAPSSSSSSSSSASSSSGSSLVEAEPVLDGVSQWSYWMSGAETLSASSNLAFIPRTEILHNMNSEAFGSGGALRMGDFKLVVEPKVSESEVYTYAQHVLQDGDFDFAELSMVVGKKLLKNDGTVKIFNIAKNPSESELCSSDSSSSWSEGDDVEACQNLAGDEDFKQVEIALMDKWKAHRDGIAASAAAASAAASAASASSASASASSASLSVSPLGQGTTSTVAFQDDGPLCNPALFGGFWTSWRDESGLPYATYATVPTSTHFDDPTDADSSSSSSSSGSSSSSSSGGEGGVSAQVDGSGHANKEKGDADGSGSKTWKQQTKAVKVEVNLAAAAAAAVGPSSSSSPSGVASSPLALVGAGSVLGAVVALAAVVVGQRLRSSSDGKALGGYSPVPFA